MSDKDNYVNSEIGPGAGIARPPCHGLYSYLIGLPGSILAWLVRQLFRSPAALYRCAPYQGGPDESHASAAAP